MLCISPLSAGNSRLINMSCIYLPLLPQHPRRNRHRNPHPDRPPRPPSASPIRALTARILAATRIPPWKAHKTAFRLPPPSATIPSRETANTMSPWMKAATRIPLPSPSITILPPHRNPHRSQRPGRQPRPPSASLIRVLTARTLAATRITPWKARKTVFRLPPPSAIIP